MEQVNEGQCKINFSPLYFQGDMKTVILRSVASGTSKRVSEWVIKGHVIMRFGTECKVFLEMNEIRKVKLYFVFCRFNVVCQ